jgi:hypothetical protein
MTTGLLIWYLATSILMAAILFKPVKKFIFVQKVRKAEGKLKRELSEEERQELEKKSVPVTAVIVVTFAFVFNKILIHNYFISK